jgi:signal transduction histidine kinase
VVLGSLVFFAGAVPLAKVPLAPLPAFLPIYQSALVICDLITAVLLFGQYGILRSRALLVLAAGYLFSALMAIAHALSFPGLFAPAGLLHAGPQTTAWLYFLWHAGFPLFLAVYALTKNRPPQSPASCRSAWPGLMQGAAIAFGAAAAGALIATVGHEALPAIMNGNVDAPMKVVVAAATWLLGFAALFILWRSRPHAVLDLWLMVVLCAWTADSTLAALFNHGRYDLGWYAGRVYGLLASAFVLAVLLLENGMLYARLAESNVFLKKSRDELAAVVAQLEVANRDLNRFAGAVAHDLQQPVLSVIGYAQLVHKRGAHLLQPADAASLKRIVGAAENADRMIQALLEFARLGQKEIETVPVDLNQVLEDARDALAREIEAKAVACRPSPLPVVRGDPSLLLLAFVNLLSNGIKYAGMREQPSIEIDSSFDEKSGHAIRIRDNGVGFDMAHAGRLFMPFERLHPKEFEGTGMGLANVRRIMERHGGSVHAQSAPGEGATFTLVFHG